MRGSTVLSTIALLALLVTGQPAAATGPGEARSSGSRTVSGVRDSALLTTPVVARGIVRDGTGGPAAGADVVLMAWPSNDVTAKLEVGDEVALQPVAVAVTSSDGSFALRLESTDMVAPLSDAAGIVNFDVVAMADNASSGTFSFARQLTVTGAGPELTTVGAKAGDPGSTEPAEFALKYGEAPEDAKPEPQLRVDESAEVIANDAPPLQKDGDIVCRVGLAQDLGNKWALVGQTYNATTYVESRFIYINGASSELGVGISGSGNYGTFRAAGTSGRSTTVTQDYGAAGHNAKRYFDTQFRWGKFRHVCYDSGSGYQWTSYSVRNTMYAGYTRIRAISFYPNATHCGTQWAGTTYIKDETRAITWTDGVELAGMGMSFSSQTGYSSTARISYRIGPFNRHLCGLYEHVGGRPGIVVSKP